MHDWMWGGGGMWIGPIFWLVILGLVVWLFSAVIRPGRVGGGSFVGQPPTSRQILDERFARGEIDEQEYRRRREILGV